MEQEVKVDVGRGQRLRGDAAGRIRPARHFKTPDYPKDDVAKGMAPGGERRAKEMVTPGRLELPTRSLGNCCSIHLSYGATCGDASCSISLQR